MPRPKGSLNKNTAEIRAMCVKHGPAMVKGLLYLAEHAESEAVRVQAIRELLDRAYGRSVQPVSDPDGAPLAMPSHVQFILQVQE